MATAPAAAAPGWMSGTPWFARAMERTETSISGYRRSKTFRGCRAQLQVGDLPLLRRGTHAGKGHAVGVLLIDLKYSALASLFSSVKLSGSGYVYLIDGDGGAHLSSGAFADRVGLVTEGNQTAAAYRDGIYTQTWNGEKAHHCPGRGCTVKVVGRWTSRDLRWVQSGSPLCTGSFSALTLNF